MDQHLTRAEFAAMLGVAPDTLSSYVNRGQAPSPDGHIGRTPYWLPSTAKEYATRVKRPGSRTDLKPSQGAST